jgi:heme/copper-type cytochrome/quinol oxidase subunit 2
MRYMVGSLTLALVASAILVAAPAWPRKAAAAQEVQVVDIVAERFRFTPSEIRVKAGTRLAIRLRSEDTIHGFHLVGTDVDLDIPGRGGEATVMFRPEAGSYTLVHARSHHRHRLERFSFRSRASRRG